MENRLKIGRLAIVFCFLVIQSAYAQTVMNNQTAIINQLKAQAIEPNKNYFQHDFSDFLNKEYSFPQEKLFLAISNALETDPSMLTTARQNIAQVKLNNHYQYQDVFERDRNIIEILYPTDQFQALDDGVHFYIFDENNQLQKKEKFEDIFKLPCYLRVEKKNGVVISIQKKPLTAIAHFVYDYWSNQNLKHAVLEMYNNDHHIIYFSEAFYDENGKRIKSNEKNILTGQSMQHTDIEKDGIERIEEYFDNKGIKTNHVIYYDKSKKPYPWIKNQRLNQQGEVIETTNQNPDDIFDTGQSLEETHPYNTLIMDVEKSDITVTDSLFKHTFDINTTPWDSEAINRAKFLGIKPNQTYYNKLPYPNFFNNRYKNFPHQSPLSLIEAENQQPKEEYSDLIKFEVGDNYQYKTLIKEKWQQSPITLPLEQFKPLENDIYFFTMADNGQLQPLDNVEQAVALPSYIRVEKEMGKIISIIQKTRIIKVAYQFEYNDNTLTASQLNVLQSPVFQDMLIESQYENGNSMPTYQVIKNADGIIIRTFKFIKIGEVKEGEVNVIYERFNNKGVKTNHITLSVQNNRDVIKNEYLDEKGQVTHTTDLFEDSEINNRQFYDRELPLFPDDFEYGLFDFYLEHHQPSEESK
ncbi:hypothetical protein A9G11_01910 [Gilliamella sp. wkB108]|uniref:hypothetical protein n=1 Tax=Gilliamella sp. wkB108 TaxID=3120256 RepID=UPI00080E42FC|nr:hypothetical protein [Gilliamella apicola]OCG25875.1 hypothetical protein A9G11_01910 [Gilliamella apicola]